MATTLATSALPAHELASSTSTTDEKPRMTHLPSIQHSFQPPLIANENAFLGDVATSQVADPEKPITSGFFRLKPGTPLIYTYTYHEMKIILEGSYIITDVTPVPEAQRTGSLGAMEGVKSVNAKPGDSFYFPKGVTIRFETESGGLAFYTGQRAEGAA